MTPTTRIARNVAIVTMLITILPFNVVAEEVERPTKQTEEAAVGKEKVYYVEESDNDSSTHGNWRLSKGYCPLEVPGTLSYKEAQERRANNGKR